MFNIFKYDYKATYLSDEAETGYAMLNLEAGSKHAKVMFPKTLLPQGLRSGDQFNLQLQPNQAAEKDRQSIMRKLLEELIQ